MVLKDRRGFTGVADTMFFIAFIGIAASALSGCMSQDEPAGPGDPSEFADTVFTGRVRGTDFGYIDGPRVEEVAAYTAASLILEDGTAEKYLEELAGKMYGDPGRYRLTVSCRDAESSVGGLAEKPSASYSHAYGTPYGDLEVLLELA